MCTSHRVALVYVGDEQPSWGRQAFAAPRHYYVMPAILYLKESLLARAQELGIDSIGAFYFNRSLQSFDFMLQRLVKESCDVVGFSNYSWNIETHLALGRELKKSKPETRIIMGGPEVSFRDPGRAADFMDRNRFVDTLVLGEGERSILGVVNNLLDNGRQPTELSGVVHRTSGGDLRGGKIDVPLDINEIPRIDYRGVHVDRTPDCGLAAVYETYRGCPYTCAYCSFGGLSREVRRFSLERVLDDIIRLFETGVEQLHFADSVFDLGLERAKKILRICLEANKETSLFCYASLQNMDEELAALLEQSRIQVGIGLQAWHPEVLSRVNRKFSIERFEKSVSLLGTKKVNYYVDFMFGLPGDNMTGFRETTNRVMALEPTFAMPFPLTIIPRSELAEELQKFEVTPYSAESIADSVRPTSGMTYANIGLYNEFGLDDLRRFDDLATSLFFSYQRYPLTYKALLSYAERNKCGLDAFFLMEQVGRAIRTAVGESQVDILRPPFVDGTVRTTLIELLEEMGGHSREKYALGSLMRIESGVAGLLARSDRRAFHRTALERESRRLPRVGEQEFGVLSTAFLAQHRIFETPYPLQSLLALDIDEDTPRKIKKGIVVTPFDHFKAGMWELDPVAYRICSEIPPDKEILLSSLDRRMARLKKRQSWTAALQKLAELEILGIYRL